MKHLIVFCLNIALIQPAYAELSPRERALCNQDERLIASLDEAINNPKSRSVIAEIVFRGECKDLDRSAPNALGQCRDRLELALAPACKE